ncbi:MAG: zinc ribbon domain-containing protein [Capsulimonadaceae bacterium]|nr:zinc ribbon domain-containing protein [Capsulimonadaceae bacterium]
MPTYAYQCDSCGNEIEVFQKMSDDPLTECEACGGDLKKRMFPVGIVFKGSGFYVNDYAKKDGAKSSTSALPAPAAETSSETKTETKAEAAPSKAETSSTPAAAAKA